MPVYLSFHFSEDILFFCWFGLKIVFIVWLLALYLMYYMIKFYLNRKFSSLDIRILFYFNFFRGGVLWTHDMLRRSLLDMYLRITSSNAWSPYVILEIKSRLAACKANTLFTVFSLWPLEPFIILIIILQGRNFYT